MIIEHEANPSWAVAPSTPKPKAMGQVDEIEALLRRYPLLNQAETARCIDFLAAAPIAERGSLSSRPGMAAKMDQLRRDHPKPFRPSILSYAVFGVLMVAIVLSGFLVAG
ncbi:MAG: hypothetical protein ACAH11_00830 [Sphingomonas sp.]